MKRSTTTIFWALILWVFIITLSGCGSSSNNNNEALSIENAETQMKALYNNVSDFDGVPKWAKTLGVYELKWFDIIAWESAVIEYSPKNYMPESMSLVYAYDNEKKAIEAAEKLSANMGIKESNHSPRLLQKQIDESMKSMEEHMTKEDKEEYENNKMSGYIADQNKWDYYVMVSVLDWKISIIVNNNAQMEEIMK